MTDTPACSRQHSDRVAKPVTTLKNILLLGAIVALAAVFGGSLYETSVNAPNFNANIPESLEHYRLFISVKNPGNFFRVVAPAAQILVLISLLLNWKRPVGRRWWLFATAVFIISVDIITFTVHYPRNALMFTAPMTVPVEILQKAAAEWLLWNYARVALVLGAFLSSLWAITLGDADGPNGGLAIE